MFTEESCVLWQNGLPVVPEARLEER